MQVSEKFHRTMISFLFFCVAIGVISGELFFMEDHFSFLFGEDYQVHLTFHFLFVCFREQQKNKK